LRQQIFERCGCQHLCLLFFWFLRSIRALSTSSSRNSLTNVRNQIRTLGLRVKTFLSAVGFKQKEIFTSSVSTVPPWLLNRPFVDLSLNNFAKSETNAVVFKSKFLEICDDLQGYCHIYTDGSKTNNGTAAAAVSGDVVKSLRITSHASIFTAEVVALNLALDIIRRSRLKKFVIFSDSLSGLVAIRNCQLETEYFQKFFMNYCQLVNAGKVYYPCLDTRSYWYPR